MADPVSPVELRRAFLFHMAGDYAEAETLYRRAMTVPSLERPARRHLIRLLDETHRWEEGAEACREALELAPTDADMEVHLALRLLGLGRLEEAWPHYEARARTRAGDLRPKTNLPEWDGRPIRSIVVWDEQGFGDSLQFARFLPMLRAHGVQHISFVCRPALAKIMATLEGVEIIPAEGTIRYPAADAWAMLASLPLRLGISLEDLPGRTAYLRAPANARAAARGKLRPGARIGVVPRGRALHDIPGRSLPQEGVAFLLSLPGATAISPEDTGEPADFADTAALIEQLDLVITVDTATAHLAGALGKPCWVLLNDTGDWRWMHDRTDSPWYPSIRLYRQTTPGDWSSVLRTMAGDLQAFLKAPR